MKSVKNQVVTIVGFPGSGKTILSVFFSYFYNRVYANFGILVNNKIKNIQYETVDYLDNIKYQDEKGLIIIDEGGLNINSRRSMSNKNLMFGKLVFLSRKKNCDLVVIGQIEESIDNYFRKLSEYTFLMNSYYINGGLKFEASIKKQSSFGVVDMGIRSFDLIKFLNKYNYSYSTLESSII